MRFDGETTLGLDVREREMGRFMVFDVEKGGPGARAGMTAGQWLLSYKLYPFGPGDTGMLPSSRLRHELWTSDTDSLLDRHPANHAFIISVISPDGFTLECEQRMDAMNDALHAVRLHLCSLFLITTHLTRSMWDLADPSNHRLWRTVRPSRHFCT
jgi:hypothetical protein